MAQIVYARVNQILEDEFTLLGTDAARTPITGKVQSDFTITLSRGTTTGLSTSGITITEIAIGKYQVVVAAATLTTTGTYLLRIAITISGQAYVYEGEYVVTSDGAATGTVGLTSFTATASNGRVTDGSVALNGVTVYIRNSSQQLYSSTSTNSSGIWGPVFFPNGTYTVYTQLAGYAQGAATLTISSGTATLAPASDISMAVVSTGTGLTASDLVSYARRMMHDRTGPKADTELLQSVNMALDMVTKAKIWPKYVTRGQITLNGIYTTGTITTTVSSAAITLSGGTWPTWAASGRLLIAGQVYRVLSRDSSSQVTIEATWVDSTTAGSNSYTLFEDTYALPNDMFKFGRLVPGQRWPYGGDPTSPEMLIEAQMVVPYAARGPTIWTFIDQSIVVYPYPSQDILCGYWYYRRPTPLVNPTDEADFDPSQIELLRRAIDYQVAALYGSYSGGTAEQAMSRFNEAMGRSAPNDRSAITTHSPMMPPMMGSDIPLWLRRTS